LLKVEAFKLAAIFVINSVAVKAKIQRPGPTRPRPGPSRPRPRPRTQMCPRGQAWPVLEDYITGFQNIANNSVWQKKSQA